MICNNLIDSKQVIHLNPIAKSDHETLLFLLYIYQPMPAEREDSRYDLSKPNFAQMTKEFENSDWSYLHEASINQGWEIVQTRIHKSLNGNIQKVEISKNNRLKPVWMAGKIKKSIKKKCNLYKKFVNSNKSHDYQKYVLCRNQCHKYSDTQRKNTKENFQRSVDQIQSMFGNTFNQR